MYTINILSVITCRPSTKTVGVTEDASWIRKDELIQSSSIHTTQVFQCIEKVKLVMMVMVMAHQVPAATSI